MCNSKFLGFQEFFRAVHTTAASFTNWKVSDNYEIKHLASSLGQADTKLVSLFDIIARNYLGSVSCDIKVNNIQ